MTEILRRSQNLVTVPIFFAARRNNQYSNVLIQGESVIALQIVIFPLTGAVSTLVSLSQCTTHTNFPSFLSEFKACMYKQIYSMLPLLRAYILTLSLNTAPTTL